MLETCNIDFNLLSSLQLIPTEGMVRRNNHLKIGRYHQHLHELLDMDVSPIAYMMKQFPDELKEVDAVRKIIGRYGITGKAQVRICVGTIGYRATLRKKIGGCWCKILL